MSREPRTLTPVEAGRTLAHRFAARADRLRQVATRFGLRPYNVSLVWIRWSGEERGEGKSTVIQVTPILPNPVVEDLSAVALDPRNAGILPVGSVRLTRISACLTADQLLGRCIDGKVVDRIPGNVEFFYELVEDGRAGDQPRRERFRPASDPVRRAGKVDYSIVLERISEDRDRGGREQIGPDRT